MMSHDSPWSSFDATTDLGPSGMPSYHRHGVPYDLNLPPLESGSPSAGSSSASHYAPDEPDLPGTPSPDDKPW